MTIYQFKVLLESANPDSKFFSKNNMKFSGDTMQNYGIRLTTISTVRGEEVVFEVYRKKPVKFGMQDSYYFRKSDFSLAWKI